MILIIHDLDKSIFNKSIFSRIENSKIIDLSNIKHCVGCFNCWTKTPGLCNLNDDYVYNSLLLKNCSKLIVISKNNYGCFSAPIKNFFDRSISYVKPQFKIIFNEMHHKKRYKKKLNIEYYFYGDITEKEKNTIQKLIIANQENIDTNAKLYLIEDIGEYLYE